MEISWLETVTPAKRILRFSKSRKAKIVWEFDEWELVGNGLACWEILDAEQSSMIRKKISGPEEVICSFE